MPMPPGSPALPLDACYAHATPPSTPARTGTVYSAPAMPPSVAIMPVAEARTRSRASYPYSLRHYERCARQPTAATPHCRRLRSSAISPPASSVLLPLRQPVMSPTAQLPIRRSLPSTPSPIHGCYAQEWEGYVQKGRGNSSDGERGDVMAPNVASPSLHVTTIQVHGMPSHPFTTGWHRFFFRHSVTVVSRPPCRRQALRHAVFTSSDHPLPPRRQSHTSAAYSLFSSFFCLLLLMSPHAVASLFSPRGGSRERMTAMTVLLVRCDDATRHARSGNICKDRRRMKRAGDSLTPSASRQPLHSTRVARRHFRPCAARSKSDIDNCPDRRAVCLLI